MAVIKGRRFVVDGVTPEPPEGKVMKFEVVFDTPPTSLSVVTPKFKYNKIGHFAMDVDDGGWRIGNPVIQFISSKTYTDGCGNAKPYTGSLALNGGTGIPSDPLYNQDYLQEPEIRSFIDLNWDISNHGDQHGPSPTALLDTNTLDARMTLRTNYKLRSTCIPTNFDGYAHAAFLLNYIYITSQGDYYDEFKPTMTHKLIRDIYPLPVFTGITRDFNDEWAEGSAAYNNFMSFFKAEIDSMFVPNPQRNYLRMGTHSSLNTTAMLNGYKAFINYLHNTSADRLIACTTREFFEYLEMKQMPMSFTVTGNVATVVVDLTNLNDRNRWRDLSFVFTSDNSTTITAINPIAGITSTSFNPTTKLVNIFKQKKVW